MRPGRPVDRAAGSAVPARMSSPWRCSGGSPSAASTSPRSGTSRRWAPTAKPAATWSSTAHARANDRGGGWRRRRTASWPASPSRQRRRITATWGYLGVVPELRGRGYVDDLLGEINRIHSADGARRISATTDVPNTPMAAAFDRANYQVTEVRMVFQAPSG